MSTTSKLLLAVAAVLAFSSCGPKAFVKGEYDDVNRENLMDDQWSETDMQVAVKSMVDSMVTHPSIANAKKMPIVMVTNLQNKTTYSWARRAIKQTKPSSLSRHLRRCRKFRHL